MIPKGRTPKERDRDNQINATKIYTPTKRNEVYYDVTEGKNMIKVVDVHPNERFIDLNIRSKLLNQSELARRLGMKQQAFSDRLRGKMKPFTPAELIQIEEIVKLDLGI